MSTVFPVSMHLDSVTHFEKEMILSFRAKEREMTRYIKRGFSFQSSLVERFLLHDDECCSCAVPMTFDFPLSAAQ